MRLRRQDWTSLRGKITARPVNGLQRRSARTRTTRTHSSVSAVHTIWKMISTRRKTPLRWQSPGIRNTTFCGRNGPGSTRKTANARLPLKISGKPLNSTVPYTDTGLITETTSWRWAAGKHHATLFPKPSFFNRSSISPIYIGPA